MAYQTFDIPLFAQLNTRDDPKVLQVGTLSDLQNGVFTTGGRLDKRNGYDEFPPPEDFHQARYLGTRGGSEVVFLDGRRLWSSLSLDPAGAGWVDRGHLPLVGVSVSTVAGSTDAQTNARVLLTGSAEIWAWQNGTGGIDVTARLEDTELAPTTIVTSATDPWLTPGPRVWYAEGGNVRVYNYVTAAITTVFNDAHATVPHLHVVEYGSKVFLAYRTSGSAWKVAIWSPGAGVEDTASGGTNIARVLGVAADPLGDVGVMFLNTSTDDLTIRRMDSNLDLVGSYVHNLSGSSERPDTGCLGFDANGDLVGFTRNQMTTGSGVLNRAKVDAAGATAETWTLFGGNAVPAAQPFVVDGEQYLLVHNAYLGLQGSYFVLDSQARLVARLLADEANVPGERLAPTALVNPTQVCLPLVKRGALPLNTGVYTQPDVMRGLLDFEAAPSVVEHDGVLFVGSGLVWAYDGQSCVEVGFSSFVESLAPSVASGGGITWTDAADIVQYRVYPEWHNARGHREQGTGVAITVTLGNPSSSPGIIQLNLPYISLTQKTGVSWAVYRTEVNGTVFHRASSSDPAQAVSGTPSTPLNGYPPNRQGGTIWRDALSDADLASRELDYQNTGEIDNTMPPALRALTYLQGRVFGISCDDPTQVHYSKLGKPGEALAFNDGLFFEMPDEVRGVGLSRDQVVVWTAKDNYVVPGEGSDNLGNGNYERPVTLHPGRGLAVTGLLARCSLGWMYFSPDGWRVLGDDLGDHYPGSEVRPYNSQDFAAVTYLPEVNQVRCLSPEGRTLVWDIERNIWSTFTNHEGVSAVNWQGKYVYLRSNGYVFVESPEAEQDGEGTDGAEKTFALSVTTGWIRVGGALGYARLGRLAVLGERYNPGKLRLEVGYNDRPAFRDNVVVNMTTADRLPFTRHCAGTRAHSFRVRITELAPDEGEHLKSFSLNGMSVEVAPRARVSRLASHRRL